MRRHAFILVVSVAGALVAAAVSRWVLHANPEMVLYATPVVAPFVAFLLERWLTRPVPLLRRLALDAAVIGLAGLRVVAPPWPYASGHALFTTYAALTAPGPVSRALAVVVLAQTLFTKLVLWHDWRSPLAGLVLAGVAVVADSRFAAPATAGSAPRP